LTKHLSHIGVARRSGRYPWGSGEDPQQRNRSFAGTVSELKKKGLKQVEIAKGLGVSTTELRKIVSLASTEKKQADAALAQRLKDKGLSTVAIGKRMDRNESSIRAMLNPKAKERNKITDNIADVLREAVNTKRYIDVGVNVERYLGVSRTRLKTAIKKLEDEGYKVHFSFVDQLGTGKKTSLLILTDGKTTSKEVYHNRDKIRLVQSYSEDGGQSFNNLKPVKSVKLKRIKIRYGDEGGSLQDGIIELRRGVPDISLGQSKYAQVRIGVNDTHYMKGMALYSDTIPDGYDMVYNTNKPKGTPSSKVFKEMKDDIDNPFGATVRQKEYIDVKGIRHLSALNIVNEEGDWGKWSRSISSQMLSKQSDTLAKSQLKLGYDIRKDEFDSINSLTNNVVRKKLLEAFADGTDAASVHLKAAALPRQLSQVILPFSKMKENEIYAPNFKNGERVVLIRYPHGGIFEIPELIVNNKNKEAKASIAQAVDAVGIHPKVAERLSGADFDGDTVLVIPNNNRLIKTAPALAQLKDFDPKVEYKGYPGMKAMTTKTTGMQMGLISNLITDMTIKGAPADHLAKAVKHSMVVIDAQKHELDYKRSHIENGIARLKIEYQGSARSGAKTVISRASSETDVLDRKFTIDKLTGEKVYTYTNKSYINKQGKEVFKSSKSTKMAETKDAHTLSSGTVIEKVYADYANQLKTLSNLTRKIAVNIKPTGMSASAKVAYANEVESLNRKLNIALMNSPLERHSQLLANTKYKSKIDANPNMSDDDKKRLRGQELASARAIINPKGKHEVVIEPKEWEAIQSGAISSNKLKQILDNTDLEKVKQMAMPRQAIELSEAQATKAKTLLKNGYTQAEVANELSMPLKTLTGLLIR